MTIFHCSLNNDNDTYRPIREIIYTSINDISNMDFWIHS